MLCWLFGTCAIVGLAMVHDGDTLRIGAQSIRLQGVDAEELSEPHGYQARNVLINIVKGQRLECHVEGRSYNRRVATCFVGNLDIGAELIRLGAALDCAHYSAGRYRALEPAGARTRLMQKPYC